MSDPIDRQILKADLLCGDNTEHGYCFPCKEILERIDNQPAAQPEGRSGVFIPDITVEMFRNASLEGVEDFMTSGEMEDISLPSAQPEQSIAQERYEDLCEYFKDCSDQGRSVLNDRKEFKSWLDRMKWHVMECDKLGRELEKLSSAQPAPYIDSIVSEIEKTISETRERGKHHDINVRANGEMICYGLQLALEIIEEKRNGRSDIQAIGD